MDYSKFVNLYSLTKTLRFELKPTAETRELLQKTNNLGLTPVQVDQNIDNLYEQEMKPMYDNLHQKFITESLEEVKFDQDTLQQLEEKYLEYKTLSKNKNENQKKLDVLQKYKNGKNIGIIPDLQNQLRNTIIESYDKTAETWKVIYTTKDKKGKIKPISKENSYEVLTESSSLRLLQRIYPEKVNLIEDNFTGFYTYFIGFNNNRKNYYTNNGKNTEIAFRCININLAKFIENKVIFENAKSKLHNLSQFENYFKLESFSNYLTQEGIEQFNDIIAVIKSKINIEYNQKVNKNDQIKGFVKLYKQIGCKTRQQKELEKSGQSLYPEFLQKVGLGFKITKPKNKNEYQVWEAVDSLSNQLDNKIQNLQINYSNFFQNWADDYDLSKIWFRKEALNTISGRWFGGNNWSVLGQALSHHKVGSIDREGKYKIPPFVSLIEIKEALEMLENGVVYDLLSGKIKNQKEPSELIQYTAENLFLDKYKSQFKSSLFETFLSIWQNEIEMKFMEIQDNRKYFDKAKDSIFDKNIKDENGLSLHVKVVKNLVEDGYLRLWQLTKYHSTDKKGEPVVGYDLDNNFYDALNNFWGDDIDPNNIVTYHKALQSSLTEKPYTTDKIKLNFKCGTLLGGWSTNFEAHGALIFKQNNTYYLGIIDGTKFSDTEIKQVYSDINEANKAYKLNYLFQKIDNKNPPRLFIRSKAGNFSPMVRNGLIDPTPILDIYDKRLFSKGKNKKNYKEYLPKLIDYFKEGFKNHQDFRDFNFEWKDSTEYDSIDEFYEDTALMSYKISWSEINFNALKENGRIYLFEITNKDLKPKKEGKQYHQNLHTTLFLELLKPQNNKNLQLLGGGELFYRDSSLVKEKDKERSQGLEIINNNRYTEPKYFLHFPIEIKGNRLKSNFRELLNQEISLNPQNLTYLGLDRGEKHLVYYALVDNQGKIIDQGSFNKIIITAKEIDFHQKLTKKAGDRDKARKDWETIGNIKHFKEGYLSQVIYQIYRIVIEHNSLIILENLNSQFTGIRTAKVEKAVYKKFELALARKLNHLILKDRIPNEIGGALNAYQLTPEIKEVQNYEKSLDWGIIKKVNASYTSAIDPLTGWRKHIHVSNSAKENTIRELFGIDGRVQINWDSQRKCFRFDYTEEIIKDKKTVNTKEWSLYAHKDIKRYKWNPAYKNTDKTFGKIEEYLLEEKFQDLFEGLNLSQNINQQLEEIWQGNDQKWKKLIFYWNLLNQIRNTDINIEEDYADFIQSPVYSTELEDFFDSRKAAKGQYQKYENRHGQLPKNGDANGAYHIALKGKERVEKLIQ